MEQMLIVNDDFKISYRQWDGKNPGILYLSGFMSNKNKDNALYLEDFCRKNNFCFTCFDYFGHGTSAGSELDVTIGSCQQSALYVLDKLLEGPQILVGSSMGGWIMNLVAEQRQDKIAGLVGFASAPDFTKELMWDTFSDDVKCILREQGVWYSSDQRITYPITYKLIQEATNHLILSKKFNFDFPIRLLHGANDDLVPAQFSTRLKNCYINQQIVTLEIIEETEHFFSTAKELSKVTAAITDILHHSS